MKRKGEKRKKRKRQINKIKRIKRREGLYMRPISMRDVAWCMKVRKRHIWHYSHSLTTVKPREAICVGPSIDTSWQLCWQLQLVCRQLLPSLSQVEADKDAALPLLGFLSFRLTHSSGFRDLRMPFVEVLPTFRRHVARWVICPEESDCNIL
jgi:hypothetical protein